MNFNWIDVLLVLIVAVSVYTGWRRGFILGALDLVRWVGSLLAALFFYQYVARFLDSITDWTQAWTQPIAFLLIVVFFNVIFVILSNSLLRRLPRGVHKRRINKLLGVIPGLANGLITATIVAALLFSLPIADGLSAYAQNSPLANRLAVYTEQIETSLVPIFDPAIRQTLNRLTIEPESNETVHLPFKVTNSRVRPDLEEQMLEMVNRERTAVGLKPLEADPEMREVARKHSIDMFERSYFSHNTPEGKSPFDRMREDHVSFLTAGENLALAPTLQLAHTGLMNSPGHRANILRPQFGRVGIGIMDGGIRGLMVTQNFRN